jgi:hypothetical protein
MIFLKKLAVASGPIPPSTPIMFVFIKLVSLFSSTYIWRTDFSFSAWIYRLSHEVLIEFS